MPGFGGSGFGGGGGRVGGAWDGSLHCDGGCIEWNSCL